jgi:hypothetical protein
MTRTLMLPPCSRSGSKTPSRPRPARLSLQPRKTAANRSTILQSTSTAICVVRKSLKGPELRASHACPPRPATMVARTSPAWCAGPGGRQQAQAIDLTHGAVGPGPIGETSSLPSGATIRLRTPRRWKRKRVSDCRHAAGQPIVANGARVRAPWENGDGERSKEEQSPRPTRRKTARWPAPWRTRSPNRSPAQRLRRARNRKQSLRAARL